MDDATRRAFNQAFYDSSAWERASWLGVRALKPPTDLWVYQEIMHELRPEFVIECGTYEGGTTLFLASICAVLGQGHVVSVDVAPVKPLPVHPCITYITGSSTDSSTIREVWRLIGDERRCIVILDSDHSRDHVLRELRAYASLVGYGYYLIVEDTNVNGHPVAPDFGPGPLDAVRAFLNERPDFVVDRSREKFALTFNPNGYLRRVDHHSRPTSLVVDKSSGKRSLVAEKVALIRRLQEQLEEQTAWARIAVEQVRERDEIVQRLQEQLAEQTAWARTTVEQVRERDEIVQRLQKQLAEQTAWARTAVEQVRERDDIIHQLQNKAS